MQKMHDMTGNETENCKCWHKKHKQIFFSCPHAAISHGVSGVTLASISCLIRFFSASVMAQVAATSSKGILGKQTHHHWKVDWKGRTSTHQKYRTTFSHTNRNNFPE